jgi:hypothetical protein
VDLEKVRPELLFRKTGDDRTPVAAVTPLGRLSRRMVSMRGLIAGTGTFGRRAEWIRAVRPLVVGTTSASSPSR